MALKASVIICAPTEWRAVRSLFPDLQPGTTPFGESLSLRLGPHEVRFMHSGWGKTAAAASTQYLLDQDHPDLLVNLGTCGGLEGRITAGTLVLVERTLIYDLVDQISGGADSVAYYATDLDLSWLTDPLPFPVQRGPMVSGDRDILAGDVSDLISHYGAVAGDWESASIAWVARRNGVRLLILRGVSDLVSPEGGEAYGDHGLYAERTREIMTRLVSQLPAWLDAVT